MASGKLDVILRGGTIYDGNGGPPVVGDVGIAEDKIAQISASIGERADTEIDASGLAVAPGFINMLSWANESLIADGRSQGDIRQGVTLEIMGEGSSMGPWNDQMKSERVENQGDIKYDIAWTTLREYLEFLAHRGVSTNIASFVGATTIRVNVLGRDQVSPNAEQLEAMRRLTHEAMKDGAFGVAPQR